MSAPSNSHSTHASNPDTNYGHYIPPNEAPFAPYATNFEPTMSTPFLQPPMAENFASGVSNYSKENTYPWSTRMEMQQNLNEAQVKLSAYEYERQQQGLRQQMAQNIQKYKPSTSNKEAPIEDSSKQVQRARNDCIAYAKSFAFKVYLWPPSQLRSLEVANAEPPSEGKEPDSEWKLHESIRAHLPIRLSKKVKDQDFMRTFWSDWDSMRTQFKTMLRANANVLLSEFVEANLISAEDVAKIQNNDHRDACDGFKVDLLGYNKDPSNSRPMWPLVPRIAEKPGEGPFSTDILIKIMIGILYGPGEIESKVPRIKGRANIKSWSISAITYPMIACVVIGARWLVSGDTIFRSEGDKTRINYEQDYYRYMTLLRNNAQFSSALIERFNQAVINGQSSKLPKSAKSTSGKLEMGVDHELEAYKIALQSHYDTESGSTRDSGSTSRVGSVGAEISSNAPTSMGLIGQAGGEVGNDNGVAALTATTTTLEYPDTISNQTNTRGSTDNSPMVSITSIVPENERNLGATGSTAQRADSPCGSDDDFGITTPFTITTSHGKKRALSDSDPDSDSSSNEGSNSTDKRNKASEPAPKKPKSNKSSGKPKDSQKAGKGKGPAPKNVAGDRRLTRAMVPKNKTE
ncbi:hypothetical protein FRC18_000215 [Serendipita sp. 400]|nr:hypothetical protein FRC18_000215 [Serendipita sp. 400]